jgi:hypothetical protein
LTTKRSIASARSQSYRAARDLGNLQAAMKGPSALSKRYVRRAVYRGSNKALGRTLRALGCRRPRLHVRQLVEVLLAAPHLPPSALRVDVATRPARGLLTVARIADATPDHPPTPAFADVEPGCEGGRCDDHETKLTGGWGTDPDDIGARGSSLPPINQALRGVWSTLQTEIPTG